MQPRKITREKVKKAKVVEKPWGREIWIADEPEYGGKILEIKKGYSTSLHYHEKKKETIYVYKGKMRVETLGGDAFEVNEGEAITIEPGEAHKLVALDDLILIEVSTQPLNERVRIEDPYKALRKEEDR